MVNRSSASSESKGAKFLGVARIKVPIEGDADGGGFATIKGAIQTACNVPAARATYANVLPTLVNAPRYVDELRGTLTR